MLTTGSGRIQQEISPATLRTSTETADPILHKSNTAYINAVDSSSACVLMHLYEDYMGKTPQETA